MDRRVRRLFKKFKKIINYLKNYRKYSTFLNNYDWETSFLSKKSQINGKDVPWYTYSFLTFLESRLENITTIFEYGSGSSTIFFDKMGKEVNFVESSPKWYKKVSQNISNAKGVLEEDLESYPKAITTFNKKYDLIVIDGQKRKQCTLEALNYLNKHGVLILDNSDRGYYSKIFQIMGKEGFKSLTFSGHYPISSRTKSTTCFYKTGNVLGI